MPKFALRYPFFIIMIYMVIMVACIDGQRSVCVPVLKQGGASNTIAIVDGMKAAIKDLVDIPSSLKTAVVFRIAAEEGHDGSQAPSFFRRFEIR
jgi:hypothetical protein